MTAWAGDVIVKRMASLMDVSELTSPVFVASLASIKAVAFSGIQPPRLRLPSMGDNVPIAVTAWTSAAAAAVTSSGVRHKVLP